LPFLIKEIQLFVELGLTHYNLRKTSVTTPGGQEILFEQRNARKVPKKSHCRPLPFVTLVMPTDDKNKHQGDIVKK
jgi:hypothetical protein